MIEAAINLCVSLAAVQYLRMYGVLLGTIVALLYRTNDIIIYVNTKILKRSPLREYAVYAVNGSTFMLFVVIAKHVQLQTDTYFQCLLQAGMVSVIVLLVYALVNTITYKTILKPNK